MAVNNCRPNSARFGATAFETFGRASLTYCMGYQSCHFEKASDQCEFASAVGAAKKINHADPD
jgi:hypothetical protein